MSELTDLIAALVAIDSVNPDLGADDAGARLRSAVAATGAAATVSIEVVGHPLETPADDPIAALLCRHAGVEPTGMPYWTDAATLAAAGIPAVLFGPSGAGAHEDEEWVDLPSVERVKDVLVTVARDFCGVA